MGQKLVMALALLISLQLLEWVGFDPQGGNSPAELEALAYIYVFPPWLFYAIAVIILWRYPINAARLAKIRAAFDRRDKRRNPN